MLSGNYLILVAMIKSRVKRLAFVASQALDYWRAHILKSLLFLNFSVLLWLFLEFFSPLDINIFYLMPHLVRSWNMVVLFRSAFDSN